MHLTGSILYNVNYLASIVEIFLSRFKPRPGLNPWKFLFKNYRRGFQISLRPSLMDNWGNIFYIENLSSIKIKICTFHKSRKVRQSWNRDVWESDRKFLKKSDIFLIFLALRLSIRWHIIKICEWTYSTFFYPLLSRTTHLYLCFASQMVLLRLFIDISFGSQSL